jgi:hypothetical protein
MEPTDCKTARPYAFASPAMKPPVWVATVAVAAHPADEDRADEAAAGARDVAGLAVASVAEAPRIESVPNFY